MFRRIFSVLVGIYHMVYFTKRGGGKGTWGRGIAVMSTVEKDRKLRNLILYVSKLSEPDPKFGKTKLNKLLFYCDFGAYLTFGDPITGQEYKKFEYGPVPKRMYTVQNRMLGKELAFQNVESYGRPQQKPIALREPDLSQFSSNEIALVNDVVRQYWDLTATQISNHSHRFLGWNLADMDEAIPYPVALVAHRDLTPEERKHGEQLEAMSEFSDRMQATETDETDAAKTQPTDLPGTSPVAAILRRLDILEAMISGHGALSFEQAKTLNLTDTEKDKLEGRIDALPRRGTFVRKTDDD